MPILVAEDDEGLREVLVLGLTDAATTWTPSIALAQERDAAWYRSTFAKVERESRRMRRLLEDMLWLARFDAAAAPASGEPVDLGTLARQAADRFAAVAETRHLALGVHVPSEPVSITASAELVDRLIGVLVDNACRYAPRGRHGRCHRRGRRDRAAVDHRGRLRARDPRRGPRPDLRPVPPLGVHLV